MDGWMETRRWKQRKEEEGVFSQYIRRWWIIVSRFSRCGVCMSHCCGVAHVSHTQIIWFLDMFSWCRSESVHMLVSIKVNSAHCEQMNPKQTKNTWSTMTIRKDSHWTTVGNTAINTFIHLSCCYWDAWDLKESELELLNSERAEYLSRSHINIQLTVLWVGLLISSLISFPLVLLQRLYRNSFGLLVCTVHVRKYTNTARIPPSGYQQKTTFICPKDHVWAINMQIRMLAMPAIQNKKRNKHQTKLNSKKQNNNKLNKQKTSKNNQKQTQK